MPQYITTVHILVNADSKDDAFDGVSEMLRNCQEFVTDWMYASKTVTRFDYPHRVELGDKYEEGDMFELVRKRDELNYLRGEG